MPARRFPPPWSVEVVADKKEAPLPGLKKEMQRMATTLPCSAILIAAIEGKSVLGPWHFRLIPLQPIPKRDR
jgi:hypothetical protein